MAGLEVGRAFSPIVRFGRAAVDRLMDAFRFFRCEFWVVSVFPAWVGWCLATGELAPEFADMLSAYCRNELRSADVQTWAADHWRVGLGLFTLGPFLGGAIMVTNDYFDRQVDVFNPKKAKSPLVRGTATPARARVWMIALSIATIVSGALIDVRFAALLALGLAMSFAYSAPPFRLKARPLGDVLMNAVGYGGITTLAGWGLGSEWSGPIPLGGLLVVALAIAAGYIPTVMMDRDADVRSGLRTTAVAFGQRAAWILGFQALIAANVAMVGMSLFGIYVDASFVPFIVPFFLIEAGAYVLFVRHHAPKIIFLGGSIVTLAFFGNLILFLMAYTATS